jgi:hypothetical protein
MGIASSASLRASVIEQTHAAAVSNIGSVLSLDGSVLRAIADNDGADGFGIIAVRDQLLGHRALVSVLASVIESGRVSAIALQGSDLTLAQSTLRDTDIDPNTQTHGNALAVQIDGDQHPSTATVSHALFERSFGMALLVAGSELSVADVIVRDTKPWPLAEGFGDGMLVASFFGVPGKLHIVRSIVADSARAGISCFGAAVDVTDSKLACNAIDMNGEIFDGPFSFDDGGGNICGCDNDESPCRVRSANLAPPPAP